MTKPSHWLILILVLLLLFGAKKLPDLARSIGQSMKIFKKEIKDLSEDDTTPPAAPQQQAYTQQPPVSPQVPGVVDPHSTPTQSSPTTPGTGHSGGAA
ncbi:Sec-independent protein translocase subunit TatA [Jonesia quinghaiensis]|uniref:Sec-independent protein translocase subunit TatA n=1 Tax=Jonesia quinghaiensis TaxID=262806 RepID=UPI0006859064